MARVKGPNGLSPEMPDGVAKTLVDSPSGDYEYVNDAPAPVRSVAKKATSAKKKN